MRVIAGTGAVGIEAFSRSADDSASHETTQRLLRQLPPNGSPLPPRPHRLSSRELARTAAGEYFLRSSTSE
jgi:16S rRNA G966 N2-methylase RsmD